MEDKASIAQSIQRSCLQLPSHSSDQPSSPLEKLDPQRLREQAVVSQFGSHTLQGHWSPAATNMNINSPIRTPGSTQSPLGVQQQHFPSGESLQQFSNQQQQFFANDSSFIQQQEANARASNIQNSSPSRNVAAPQLASPPTMLSHPQSPYITRTPNPSSNAPSQFGQQQASQAAFHAIAVNNQQMYTNAPQTPGSQGNSHRIYQIQQGTAQFAYAAAPGSQPGAHQQWITVQGGQMVQQQHFAQQPRIAIQQVPRNVQRFASGFPQGNMVYANVPGSPVPQRIQVRPANFTQVVTSQPQPIQQVLQQPPTQGPRTPQTPIGTPTTPVPNNQIGQSGVVYAANTNITSSYPGNSQQGNFVQQKAQQVRPQFSGNIQLQQTSGQIQQPITVGHFPHQRGNSAVNMRSPSIVSPNQGIPINQQQHLVRQQQMQIRPVVIPGTPTTIRPQQLNFENNGMQLSPDLCLAGCHFVLAENNSGIDLPTIITMVRYYGGEIEILNQRIVQSEKFTHVIAEYITSPPIPQLIERKDNVKRVCTLQWLNDIIERRRVEPPFKVCHLPGALNRTMNLSDKVISVTGFSEKEVVNIKWMVQVIGARFCPYLTKSTTFLVAKNPSSSKVDKVLHLSPNISIVNVNWLCELYMGSTNPLSNIRDPRYLPNAACIIEIGPISLYNLNENFARLMNNWQNQYQYPIGEEQMKHASDCRRHVLNDESLCGGFKMYDRLLEASISPTEEQISSAIQILQKKDSMPNIKIVLSGFTTKDMNNLSNRIRFLGVQIVEKTEDANFVIAPQFSRTLNILKAIASGKSILSPMWIVISFVKLKLEPFDGYFLHDTTCEKTYGFHLKASVLFNLRQPIFKNTRFYLTPSVKPSRIELAELIQCAGGKIDDDKPTKSTIAKYIEEERPYIIISSFVDLIFFSKLTECGFPIFSEDFVYCAILRHKVDTSNTFAINLNSSQRGNQNRQSMTPIQRPLISAQIR